MPKRFTSITLTILLIQLLCAQGSSAAQLDKQARDTEEVKRAIARLGTGPQARVEVVLRDKSKLKGYIDEAGDSEFSLKDETTGAVKHIAYSQVEKVKRVNVQTAGSTRSTRKFSPAFIAVVAGLIIFALVGAALAK